MNRRKFVTVAGTAAAVAVAGCGSSGGGSISGSLNADSDDFEDHISESLEVSAGDEVEITIEAGSDGSQVGFVPEEDSTSAGGGSGTPDDIGWGWHTDADETETETVEIDEDDTYVFWITQGSADVEAEII